MNELQICISNKFVFGKLYDNKSIVTGALKGDIVSEGNKSCSMTIPDIKVPITGENKGTFNGARYNKGEGKCNQVRTAKNKICKSKRLFL